MRSTFAGLEAAKTGMFSAQNALSITSHNISNAETIGYTRQRLYTSALPPAMSTGLLSYGRKDSAGRGVESVMVEQIRNPFLDHQYRKEASTTGQWTTKQQYYGYVESLFNTELDRMDQSTGLSTVFSGFYKSLNDLVKNPSDLAIRGNVQQNAERLTTSMNYYFTRLEEQQATLDETIDVAVMQVNDLTGEIAKLNEQIFGYELAGGKANDLRDQRNLLVDELSEIVDVSVSEDKVGYFSVKLNGLNLVHHVNNTRLAVDKTLNNPIKPGAQKLNQIYWADDSGMPTSSLVEIQSGAMRGYFDIRDGNGVDSPGIPETLKKLDELCRKITADVNAVHSKGWTAPNGTNGDKSQTGVNFFDDFGDITKVTARTFKLDKRILDNAYNIAASDKEVSVKDNQQLGNGEIAALLAGLINKTDSTGKPDNFDSMYKLIVTQTGIDMAHITTTAKGQLTMLSSLDQQRRSISSVSLDEEMTNVVRFGHAYNAAARVITAVDEQLDTLVNRMGLVGR